MKKYVQVIYDFGYIEEESRFTEDEFNLLKETNMMYFQVLTCQDYKVPPVFEFDDFTEEQKNDLANAISDITSWLVLSYKIT
jgi:hypothetical protein